jgi:phosphoribosylglycinamide formyltransferase-1
VSANRVGILISGRGSNMLAILDTIERGDLDAEVAVVISNDPKAAGIAAARARGVRVEVLDHRAARSREDHDRRMAAVLEAAGVRLVCLAGYMRLLTPWFVERFAGRILNIHPSLLPAFPGLDAQKQAIDHGVRMTGCTVHFVVAEMDAGPIVLQAPVAVRDDDTPETLAARILKEEHRIYSEAIRMFFEGGLQMAGRRAIRKG